MGWLIPEPEAPFFLVCFCILVFRIEGCHKDRRLNWQTWYSCVVCKELSSRVSPVLIISAGVSFGILLQLCAFRATPNLCDEGTNLQTWKSFLAAIAGTAAPDEHGDSDLQLQLLNTLTAQFPDSVDAASYEYLKEVTRRFRSGVLSGCLGFMALGFRVEGLLGLW